MPVMQMLLTTKYIPVSATGSPSPLNVNSLTAGYLEGTVTITAQDGTGSYTYSSSWLSGGTGLVLVNTSNNTPTVQATGTPTEVRTGTIRTVVSDGISSVNVDTSVRFSWGAI